MPIQSGDIKLLKSAVMADVPEGGGAPTANVIADGVSNAIFPDISELDRAGGRVNLRKTFVSIQTDDTDVYFGSNVIVAEPPQDPRVSVTLFTTGQTFDHRTDAVNRLEAYLFSGPEWNGYLLENHIVGQRTIQLFQRIDTPLPPVGRTLVLIMNEGLSNEYRQYVRVINVEAEERTFTHQTSSGLVDYQAWVVICELSDTLRYDFPGSPPSRTFTRDNTKTLVRDTRVTDAARYYGVSALKTPAALGALKAKVKTIYTQLVPSAQTEIPLANQILNPEVSPMVSTSNSNYSFDISVLSYNTASRFVAPTGITPGSISVSSGGTTDDGKGNLVRNGSVVGTVNYTTGEMSANWGFGGTATLSYKPAVQVTQQTFTLFREVTAESRRYNWIETLIPPPAPGTLSFSYMAQGNWYRLVDNGNGELRGEDSSYGAGTINYVTGNMSVTTGVLPDADTAIMLVWATPSHYAIRTTAEVETPSWKYTLSKLNGYSVVRGSVTITWEVNGVTKTLTDDGNGFLQGNGYGAIQYASGKLYFVMESLPDPGTTPHVTYQKSLIHQEEFTPTKDGNGFINITLAHPPIVPGSLVIKWETIRSKTVTEKITNSIGGVTYYASSQEYSSLVETENDRVWRSPDRHFGHFYSQTDSNNHNSSSLSVETKNSIKTSSSFRIFSESEASDNVNNVVVQKLAVDNGAGVIYGPQAGSVDYNTGVVRFIPTDIARASSWGLRSSGAFKTEHSSSNSTEIDNSWAGSSSYMTEYAGGGVSGNATSAGYSTSNGSNRSASSGGESTADSGRWGSEAFKDEWGNGSRVYVSYVEASVTPMNETETLPAQDIKFNLSPLTAHTIVQGSVMLRFGGAIYVDRNGRMIMNPDTSTGSGIDAGSINYRTGEVTLSYWIPGQQPNLEVLSCLTIYGQFVVTSAAFRTAAAPLKSESLQLIATTVNGEQIIGTANADGWILTPNMVGKVNYTTGICVVAFGNYGPIPDWQGPGPSPTVWRALPIDASTIRYNAVAYSYLPLDANILGVDPVRLPQDGRVPMYRKGEFVVVGNTQGITTNVSNGQTINCGRVRLSRVRVIGHDRQPIHTGWTADLEAGTVTFTDTTGYSQPVTIQHRVEDMVLVSDVQINGDLTFTRPLTHDYPADTSYVSSAMVIGDLFARVSLVFDQTTWNGTFSDVPGTPTTASYNNTLYPITVTNRGAVTERWAIHFTTNTTFNVIGEHVGMIATGNITTDCAPINPATGVPYFTIPALGWGSGWSVGNVLRFNTIGAVYPVWVVRTIQQGPETVPDDNFTLLIRGDVDTP